jgi:propionyl-CoA synthetase
MLPCLDETHTRWHGDQVAFIYDSPVTQTIQYTFFGKTGSSKLAGGMQSLGLKRRSGNNLPA